MKKLSYLLVLIVVTFLSVTCSSNKRTLQRGDYYNATMGAIKTLRSNPNSKKSIEVLQQAYPLAIENSMRKIQML